jgi:hypothetical protein
MKGCVLNSSFKMKRYVLNIFTDLFFFDFLKNKKSNIFIKNVLNFSKDFNLWKI